MGNKKKRTIIIIVLAVLAVVAAFAIYRVYSADNAPVTVKTQKLTKGELKETVSADGQVVSPFTQQVSSKSGIPIWSVDVALGNFVNQGAQLCTLYDKENNAWSFVTAPSAGTITAIKAVVGAPADGTLFTIQKTDDLQVNMQIKEADINTVTGGMAVEITSDTTGSRVYSGTVKSIAPTSDNTSSGSGTAAEASDSTGSVTDSTANTKVLFNAIVSVDDPEDGLHIGMKTRQSVVVQDKKDVLAVPLDALKKDSNGSYMLYTVNTDEDGDKTAHAIAVTLGFLSESSAELTNTDLKEGTEYITNPSDISDGQAIETEGQNTSAASERG